MNKYKVGDKIVLTVSDVNEKAYYSYYVFNNNDLILWEPSTDKYAEPLSTYTEPLESKIRRQAAEITRLLKKNKKLKEESRKLLKTSLSRMTEITRLLAKNKELKEDFEKSKIVNLNAGRLAGQNEAWELAQKIFRGAHNNGYSPKELAQIFGCEVSKPCIVENTYPEAAAKVKAWKKAKEKPQKTMLQDFLEKYPKAILDQDSTPFNICPCDLGYKNKQYCERSCMTCWNRPLEQIGGEE